MSRFTDTLTDDIERREAGYKLARERYGHAQQCIAEAAKLFDGAYFHYSLGRKTIALMAPIGYECSRTIVAARINLQQPGGVLITSYPDRKTNEVNCINELAIEYNIREAIVKYLNTHGPIA